MRQFSEQQIKSALTYALDNCREREQRNADGYIAFNPGDADRRKRDQDIVNVGINDMYYEILRQLSIK